jgi:POT family proton-dependent oligopeptide transporter
MLLGLIAFVLFRRELNGVGEPPVAGGLARRSPIGLSVEWTIYLGGLAGVAAAWWLVQNQGAVGVLLVIASAITVGYILYTAVTKLAREERHRIFAALILIALSPLFWALFEQQGSSLNVYTDQRVDRMILGWNVPASVFQSVNSVFIIGLAPVFAGLWTWLGKRGREPSAAFKFGIGLILVGASFFALIGGAPSTGLTPAIYVVLLYLFASMAELCFSPVGLSSTTRLSTPQMAGLMMGTWFLATAAGNFIAGLIAQATGNEGAGAGEVLVVYGRIGWFAMGVGALVLVAAPFITRLMHLETLGGGVDHALAGERELAEPAAAGTRTQAEQKGG